jgi:hypothetical protein
MNIGSKSSIAYLLMKRKYIIGYTVAIKYCSKAGIKRLK